MPLSLIPAGDGRRGPALGLSKATKANRGSPCVGLRSCSHILFDGIRQLLSLARVGVVGAEGFEPPTYAL